jgi:hypothetical protein
LLNFGKVCYKLGNLLKAEVNIGKISESAGGSVQADRRLFPAFFKFCVDFFPPFLTALDIFLFAIFVFVLFATQYKVCLGSTKRYHLF